MFLLADLGVRHGRGISSRERRRIASDLPHVEKVVVAMALAILAEIPDLTREQYELVVKKVNESGSPTGALFHAGGPTEQGYRIVEVWETRESADAFYGSEQYREAAAATPA